MARLAIDRDFLRDFAKLEKPVQDRVGEVFAKFEHAHHAGVHLEKVKNARDDRFRTIRIDRFWRGVVLAPEEGDTYTLLKVLPHDDAYAWARCRTASVNSATGRIEIRDTVAIDTTLPQLAQMAERQAQCLFDHVSDSDLRRLGIDGQTLGFARVLTDPIQLDASRSFLPPSQWDVLYGLAAGMSVDDVWAELSDVITGEPIDPDDIDAAVRRSRERVVLVDGPEELMAVFAHPFALWRVYLHPVQRSVVEARHQGPARVTGGPGTGKTVVALHRARHLADLGEGPVLVTTFTSTLADSLKAGMNLLVDSPEAAERIEVAHVDRIAHRIFREEHGSPALLSGEEERRLWTAVTESLGASFSPVFLGEEWRQVVLAQEVGSADEYLTAKRTGRGRRLGPRQKAQVWQAIWEFETQLRERGLWTHETICVEATRILRSREDRPYRHIVVDEAQDLSPEKWRLLRAAVPEAPDDLFIAGDTHQRIYSSRVSLRDVGVRITGRSTRLQINYRTTAEILAWSLGLLRGERVDDMDGGLDSIAGCRSDVRGLRPEVKGFSTREGELRHLVEKVRSWLDSGIRPEEIGVAARSRRLVEAAVTALAEASVPVHTLATGQPSEDAVCVGTMHRMKGLEFRCLVALGVSEGQIPASGAVTPAEEDETAHLQDLQRERCLLFVACTRAREQLGVTWSLAPSPFLLDADTAS
ncbi:ATP-dependent helicase [Marinactinospora endophytica]